MPPDDNERTALLNGNGNGSAAATNRDAPRPRSNTWKSVMSRTSTPGDDSAHILVRWPAQVLTVTKITLLSNYVNILLVFVPLGIVAGATGWDPVTVFILNFFAIMPLAAVLSFATEEISMKLGQTLGGLMNATFGNAVELIVCHVILPLKL
jgi:Ca2+:H+ antiporter